MCALLYPWRPPHFGLLLTCPSTASTLRSMASICACCLGVFHTALASAASRCRPTPAAISAADQCAWGLLLLRVRVSARADQGRDFRRVHAQRFDRNVCSYCVNAVRVLPMCPRRTASAERHHGRLRFQKAAEHRGQSAPALRTASPAPRPPPPAGRGPGLPTPGRSAPAL